MWQCWNDVFAKTLGRAERSIVSELMEIRNKWAHQKPFSTDDACRVLDSIHRLLNAVGAGKEAAKLETQKSELMRVKCDDQARNERCKAQATLRLELGTAVRLEVLLVRAVRPLANDGRDPVVELQTNFGGGFSSFYLNSYEPFLDFP